MYSYRWMIDEDVAELGALAQRIWNTHYPGIISHAQIDYMVDKTYSPSSLLQQLADGNRFLLVLQNDLICGFLAIAPLKTLHNPILRGAHVTDADYFLHKFYIAQEMQGKGLGKSLFKELLSREPQIKRLRLQVARKNPNSWNFYLKQGLIIEQEADFDIGGGFVMCDYVMEKQITQ